MRALALLWLVAGESEQCPPDADCGVLEPGCLQRLNDSSGEDLVPLAEVMAVLEDVGQEQLYSGAVRGDAWLERFSQRHCESMELIDFPEGAAVQRLSQRLAKLHRPLLVHSDELNDGIGARFKKVVELVAAALQLGFDSAVVNLPPAGGLLQPVWHHGAVWCHESPADGPDPEGAQFPLRCWRFELQRDFLAQDPLPEGRQLLWGAEEPELLSSESPRRCFRFSKVEGLAWRLAPRPAPRLFAAARRFAAPALTACGACGYDASAQVALHLRQGDVGLRSGYTLPQQLKEAFPRWLCRLAELLRRPMRLHVFTEGGKRRRDLRLEGFRLEPSDHDDEVVFHTMAKLENPQCDAVESVHVVVNNNPRDALLCMARADVLITSLSSLSWTAAVLNSGLVFHPEGQKGEKFHWDLRDQYLDWAENWHLASELWHRSSF